MHGTGRRWVGCLARAAISQSTRQAEASNIIPSVRMWTLRLRRRSRTSILDVSARLWRKSMSGKRRAAAEVAVAHDETGRTTVAWIVGERGRGGKVRRDATRRDVESAGAKQAVPPALPLAILHLARILFRPHPAHIRPPKRHLSTPRPQPAEATPLRPPGNGTWAPPLHLPTACSVPASRLDCVSLAMSLPQEISASRTSNHPTTSLSATHMHPAHQKCDLSPR